MKKVVKPAYKSKSQNIFGFKNFEFLWILKLSKVQVRDNCTDSKHTAKGLLKLCYSSPHFCSTDQKQQG